MKELKNWEEVSKGYYRYAKALNLAYEIIIECWEHTTPIETAKASLCVVGDWYTIENVFSTDRIWLGKELPVQELLEIAYKDNEENHKWYGKSEIHCKN